MPVTTSRAGRLVVHLPRAGGLAVIGPSPGDPGVGDLMLVATEARKTLGPALELLDAALGLMKTLQPE